MSIGIYKITSPKGKIYIGQSRNIEKRLDTYKKKGAYSQPKLDRSLKKYGFANHICEIVEICNECDLNDRECFYIEHFDVFQTDHGMNCRSGGAFGRHSEYSKELNRIAHLGKKQTPEQKAKRIESMAKFKGKKRDPSIGKKISEAKKGVKFSDEHRAKLRTATMKSQAWRDAKKLNDIKQQKPVINTETGETWPSAKIAAISNGINVGTLTPKLNGTYKNNTPFRYI